MGLDGTARGAADSAAAQAGKPRPAMAIISDKTLATVVDWKLEVYDPDPNDAYLGLFVEPRKSKAFPQSAMPIGLAPASPALPRKLRVTGTVEDGDAAGGVRSVHREAVRSAK